MEDVGGEEEWEAWGGDEGAPLPPKESGGGDTAAGEPDLGLWEVERRLFADNQAAREVLDELVLETLTETEARALLRRRVELSG